MGVGVVEVEVHHCRMSFVKVRTWCKTIELLCVVVCVCLPALTYRFYNRRLSLGIPVPSMLCFSIANIAQQPAVHISVLTPL